MTDTALSARPGRNGHLDSLRGLSILLVMIMHWLPLPQLYCLGGYGVRCFFLLSGFLTTGILLRARGSGGFSLWSAYRTFQHRRALRIYPAYFLLVISALCLGVKGMGESWGWNLTFTSNIYIAWQGRWVKPFYQLWSSATQEQFYLIWPLLVLTLRGKWLPRMMLAVVFGSMTARLGVSLMFSPNHLGIRTLMPCTADSLALGGWLAWRAAQPGGLTPLVRSQKPTVVAAAAAFGIVLLNLRGHFGTLPASGSTILEHFVVTVFPTLQVGLLFWLVAHAAAGVVGPLGRLLDNRILQRLGLISYSVYLYHLMCEYLIQAVFQHYQIPYPDLAWARFALCLSVTLVVAHVSYHWVETPIANLRKRKAGASALRTGLPVPAEDRRNASACRT